MSPGSSGPVPGLRVHWRLLVGRPRVEHVRLQSGEEASHVPALADLHVEQVRMDGGVIDLRQALLDSPS